MWVSICPENNSAWRTDDIFGFFSHRCSRVAPVVRRFYFKRPKSVWFMLWKWWIASPFLAGYDYYYDYTTDGLAEDPDLNAGDWLFELLDVTGKSLVWVSCWQRSNLVHKTDCSLCVCGSLFIQISAIPTPVYTVGSVAWVQMDGLFVPVLNFTQGQSAKKVWCLDSQRLRQTTSVLLDFHSGVSMLCLFPLRAQ